MSYTTLQGYDIKPCVEVVYPSSGRKSWLGVFKPNKRLHYPVFTENLINFQTGEYKNFMWSNIVVTKYK